MIIINTALLIILMGMMYQHMRKVKMPKDSKKRSVILDTSVIIDGRIVDIAASGFLPGKLIVPRFVIKELQLLADGRDSHKRERARFGLDTIALLQSQLGKDIKIVSDDYETIKPTDDKLVKLAKDWGAYLCTNDFNLNKVAVVSGIKVLNVNLLAQSVRPAALPGEHHDVKIVQKGSNKDQGVGYLDDGTMVVVAGAGRMIGKTVRISVTRMLQTEAGKMIFAKQNSRK